MGKAASVRNRGRWSLLCRQTAWDRSGIPPGTLDRCRGWRAGDGLIAASFRRLLPLGDEVNLTPFTHTKVDASRPQRAHPPHPPRPFSAHPVSPSPDPDRPPTHPSQPMAHAPSPTPTRESKFLSAELQFEVCIGDGGEPYDPQSPYDLNCGLGFNSSDHIEIY